MTFDLGIPSGLVVTPYGLATVKFHHENGEVDIYVGYGRVFRVPGNTKWRPV